MKRRIVVLVRDPRDSLISYWHQKRVREGRPVAPRLELFADCPVYGIERLAQGTALLLDLFERHRGDRLVVTYEDVVAQPARRLREVLSFALDGRPLDARACGQALEASRFERMRDWERALSVSDARSSYDGRFGPRHPGARGDAHFKVRRGMVGCFETDMPPALRERLTRHPSVAALLPRLAAVSRASKPAAQAEREPRPAGSRHDELEMPATV